MSDSNEQAVLIHFKYGSTELSALHALEEKLEAVLTPEIGEHDGHEIAVNGSDGTLYFYGPDADRLWKAIEPTVRAAPFMHEAQVVLRAGSPGVGKEKTVTLP